MQRKSTKNISQQQSTWEIFGTSKKDLGASTSLLSDFRARICLLLENAGALKVAEAVYSLKRRGLFASITPLFLSLRTYPGFLPVTKDKTLKSYCERLPTLGFMSVNGNCLILPGFCPKIESGFTLSDILEKEVDKKYFLSPNVAKRILSYQPSRHDIGGGQANGGYLREITPQGTHQGARVYDPRGTSQTPSAVGGGRGAKTGLYAILTPNREEKRQNGRRMKNNGEPMFTLTAQDRHGIFNGVRVRRLTPTECCRLQG